MRMMIDLFLKTGCLMTRKSKVRQWVTGKLLIGNRNKITSKHFRRGKYKPKKVKYRLLGGCSFSQRLID